MSDQDRHEDAHEDCGCTDYRTSRRAVLQGGVVAGGLLAGTTTSLVGDVLTQTAYGGTRRGNVLVVVSLRGGVDGLSLVVPHAESNYYKARPRTAVAKSRLLHRDNTFGLHPGLAPLSPLWKKDRMAVVHAVGLPAPNRSHFDAMEELEDADPGSRERIGWLNRFIGQLGGRSIMEGVFLGSNVLPTSLVGPQPSVALATPEAIGTPFDGTPLGGRLSRGLEDMHRKGSHPVKRAGRQALELAADGGRYSREAGKEPRRNAKYPNTSLGTSLRRSAALIRAGVGVRAIAVDHGSWDHHRNLTSSFDAKVGDLAGSLAAFFTDLGPDTRRVTVVTVSEFGRRLDENGAGGVDHGYGNAVLVLGAGIKRSRYVAEWPTLRGGKQVSGDLAVTTDYRHLLREIVEARFPEVAAHKVFPGAGSRRVGVMK